MFGKIMLGILLITGLLFGGSAWADSTPDQVSGSPDAGQVSDLNENGVLFVATAGDTVDVIPYEKVAAAGGEATPAEKEPAKLDPAEPGTEDVKPASVTPAEAEADEAVEGGVIADPIEPINRAMFVFNDKLYFWFFKPLAQAYNAVVPEVVRISIRSFFRNATMPIRFVNCLLQGKFEGAGIELVRFGVNTTVGIAGFMDIARDHFELESRNEDLGQTLGRWGMGGWMYIVWPFIGPSTIRDTIGMAGDSFMEPFGYIRPIGIPLGTAAFDRFNKTSLELGSYEEIKESALEPYIAVRDAFIQHRNAQIKR